MNLNRNIILTAVFFFILVVLGCASVSEDNSSTKINDTYEELKTITVSNKAKQLIVHEDDENKLREELVCKLEKKLGTRFKEKKCYTKSELEVKRKAAKEEAKELQRQRSLGY